MCLDAPSFDHYDSVRSLPPHLLRELDRFFKDYKTLEGKKAESVEVGEMYGFLQAIDVIRKSREAFDRGDWKTAKH